MPNLTSSTASPLVAGRPPSRLARFLFDALDPLPYGCFVAALIFDAVYARSAEVMWFKSAAWLIAIGLVLAIVPRLLNLWRVWFVRGAPRRAGEATSFWLHLVAIAVAILNAFVHSRDAYGVMPDGLWLSLSVVVLLFAAKASTAFVPSNQVA